MRDLNRFLRRKFLLVFTIIYTVVFIIANVVFYLTNTAFIEDTIERENESLVEMMEHLIFYTDEDSALVFLEHYGHTHNVYLDYEGIQSDSIYQTAEAPVNVTVYDIVVNGDVYASLSVDNDQSSLIETHTAYMFIYNAVLVAIYGVGLLGFSMYFKKQYGIIVEDMQAIHDKIEGVKKDKGYYFEAIHEISKAFDEKIQRIEKIQENHKRHIRNLSHDIKTPLTILKSTLQGFESGRIEVSKTVLESLMEEINTIDQLVPKLMHASKEDTKERQNLSRIIRESLNRHRPLLENQGITLETSIHDGVYFNMEHGALERLMDHVLSNARAYAGRGSTVRVHLEKAPLRLSIDDDGPGMSDEIKRYAFDASKEGRSVKSGSGIGLSVVKDITEAHGGTLSIESTLGHGTQVQIRFPS